MKNITLAVDETVLADVRRYAAANNTTVNALVRQSLEGIADRLRRSQAEWDALFAETDRVGSRRCKPAGSRDELHKRS